MIYSVVPREMEGQLLERLTAHYGDQPDVTVIVDRRKSERRRRQASTGADMEVHRQRELRDRRRRRAGGDFAPLHGEGSQTSAA